MSAVARYLKGCKMLERYEGKLSRTVLRRGEASNRLFIVYECAASAQPSLRLQCLAGTTHLARCLQLELPESQKIFVPSGLQEGFSSGPGFVVSLVPPDTVISASSSDCMIACLTGDCIVTRANMVTLDAIASSNRIVRIFLVFVFMFICQASCVSAQCSNKCTTKRKRNLYSKFD